MVHQTAKHKNALPPKKHSLTLQPIDDIQKVQEKVHEMGRENVDTIARAAEGYSHAATESIKKGSENTSALLESGSKAAGAYRGMSSEIMKSCNQMFTESVELSREMLACRTSKDMIELHSKATQQLCESYFDATSKLCDMLFDSYADALAPFSDHMTAASDKFRKARAA